ncbi:peptidoglycan recognition protein [Streptomyces sp. NPDC003077]|uniref:peptidoglycan recognition protein family protein n=1 Tax=Streptomyces sp. NPDC003077 TaxID=3154443 RepID=UPI00339F6E91
MRPFIATSLGVACTAALTLPLVLPAGANATGAALPATAASQRRSVSDDPAASRSAPAAPPDGIPGATHSLPLVRLAASGRAASGAVRGLPARKVAPFSLVGVVWKDPYEELRGRVQVRTRATGTGTWSGWQEVQAHDDDAPDPGAEELRGRTVRGGTAPLWVGDSDAVQLRVTPERAGRRAPAPLPEGLRLELVDPGRSDADGETAGQEGAGPRASGQEGQESAGQEHAPAARRASPAPYESQESQRPGESPDPEAAASSAVNAQLAQLGAAVIPALDKPASEGDLAAADDEGRGPDARRHVGPRPRIVTRAGWGADEKLREKDFAYTKTVRAAFVHHSATGNNYRCAQAPSVVRGIYRYHVRSSGWRDLGYNFLVDKCGTIYEGRAGGVAKPVMGAHTLGFNTDSMGVAVLGSFGRANPTRSAVDALARLTAWKLGLYGADPSGTTYLVSGGGNKFKKGRKVRMRVIAGHRDGFTTECPGRRLYRKLGAARTAAARLQGR